MAKLTHEQLMSRLQEHFGEDTSDETLSLLTDIRDTITPDTNAEDWERKYHENDKAWREKYRNAFFSTPTDEGEKSKKGNEEIQINDLFNEVK